MMSKMPTKRAAQMIREGISAYTRANTLKLLSQAFNYLAASALVPREPCLGVRRQRILPSSDIRFLDKNELKPPVKAIDVEDRPFGAVDRAIVLTAAMTGMRQGELLALRWLDVDWRAKRIRVRRNYVRGYMGTPTSRSGERSVPLCSRVAAELTELRDRSWFCGDEDLVSPIRSAAACWTMPRYCAGSRKP